MPVTWVIDIVNSIYVKNLSLKKYGKTLLIENRPEVSNIISYGPGLLYSCAPSLLLWAGFGVLDGIQGSSDVKLLGVEQSGQPSTVIGEAHGEHLRKRLHQPGICIWGRGEDIKIRMLELIWSGLELATGHRPNDDALYLEEGVGRELPHADQWDPWRRLCWSRYLAGLEDLSRPAPTWGTAALLWRGPPL